MFYDKIIDSKDYMMLSFKHLTLTSALVMTLFFTGCVETPNTFGNQDRYTQTSHVKVGLVSYTYPYYNNLPYYFWNNRYYYGGYYDRGYYHFGNSVFRRGHYYRDGYRYYRGRHYKAVRGRYGYHMKHAVHPKRVRHTVRMNKVSKRGREYINHRDREYMHQKVKNYTLSDTLVHPRQRMR